MSTRSFTVFQDAPSSSNPPKPTSKPVRATSGILTRSASTSKANLSPVSDPTVAIDKENYNPLTGRKATASGLNGEKKRKTTVLALKAHVSTASTGKKPKTQPRTVVGPEAKKRKVATVVRPAAPKLKVATASKEVKVAGSVRKPKRTSPVRKTGSKTASLPKVIEESAALEAAQELSQAVIDSRCYQLTVSPLADVSEAYEASAFSGTSLDEGPFRTVKEASAEPELRDYFTLDSFTSLASSRRTLLSEEPEATTSSSAATTLSTPERAKLYASFTFSSPSPSSKRLRDTYATMPPASPTRRGSTRVTAKKSVVASKSTTAAARILQPVGSLLAARKREVAGAFGKSANALTVRRS